MNKKIVISEKFLTSDKDNIIAVAKTLFNKIGTYVIDKITYSISGNVISVN